MKKKGKKSKKKPASDEGSDASDIENKKKSKSRLRRRRGGSVVQSGSESDLSDDERRKKRKRKKKKRSSRAATATTEESSMWEESRSRKGSKITTEEETSSEKTKEITEGDLIARMKRLIPYVEPKSQLWTKWNLAPLFHFLRNKDAMIVVALTVNVHPVGDLDCLQVPQNHLNPTKNSNENDKECHPEILQRLLKIFPPDETGTSLITLNQIIPGFTGELFYFAKQCPVKLDGYNFEDMMICGNLPPNQLGGLKVILTNYWSPLLMDEEFLPSGIKDEMFTDLNTLSCATQYAVHLVEDQETLLYVPPEVHGNRTNKELSKDKKFCARLEETITYWLLKLKEVVILKELDDTETWPGPLQEIQFWEARSKNLAKILIQMRSSSLKRILYILTISRSPYIPELRSVVAEVAEAHKEASSNFHYLQMLSEPSSKMFKSKLKEMPTQMQKFIWLVLTIWRNAPFYNTPKRLNGLLRKLSNDLICHCKSMIKVEQLLQGFFIERSEKVVKNYLKLFTWWKEIYAMSEKTFLEKKEKEEWPFDYDLIFCHVDAMIVRLNNILEICSVQQLFARKRGDSGEVEDLPLYPSLQGPHISSVMKQVENLVNSELGRMSGYSFLALDVKNAEWHEHMKSLQETVLSVEIIIQNLLEEVFDKMSNLKERIELIHFFHTFHSRAAIMRQIEKLSIKLYEYFEDEIALLRKLFEQKIVPLPNTYSQMAGRGAWALYMKKRIENHLANFKKSEAWLPKSGFSDFIKSEAKSLAESMSSFAVKTYEEWANSKDLFESRDYKSKLDVPLLIRKGREKKEAVEVNYNRAVYKHLTEAEIWQRVGRPIPSQIMLSLYLFRDKLHDLLENVSFLAKSYNNIITNLSTDENLLFRDRLLPLEKRIYPCLVQFTWSSSQTADDNFVQEFHSLVNELRRQVKRYREANSRVAEICTRISKRVRMVQINPKRIYDPTEYRSGQNEMIQSQIFGIVKEYKEIADILQEVYKIFKNDGVEVKVQWGKYVKLIDECFEEALCISLRDSLKILEDFICTSKEKPVFKLEMQLEDNNLTFKPNLKSLSEMILGTHGNVALALQPLNRISQYLGIKSKKAQDSKSTSFSDALLNDKILLEIQDHLKFSIEKCFSELNLFCDRWTPYRDVWEVDRSTFMLNYEKQYPDIEAYENDLEKYLEISKVVQGSESMANIRFLQVDCTKLKEEIGKESHIWFEIIAKNLYEKAKTTLGGIYDFMKLSKNKLSTEPGNVEEQMYLFQLYEEIKSEGKRKLNQFPGFCEQFELLERFDFELEQELKDSLENLDKEWRSYQRYLKEVDKRLQKSYDKLRAAFLDQAEIFNEKVNAFFKSYENEGPFSGGTLNGRGQSETEEDYYDKALIYLDNILNDVKSLKKEEMQLNESLKVFNLVRDKNQILVEMEVDVLSLIKVWGQVKQWNEVWKSWKTIHIQNVNSKRMDDEALNFSHTFIELSKEFEVKSWPVITETIEFIETVRIALETVEFLKNQTLRARHWEKIKDILGSAFDHSSHAFNLEKVVQLKLYTFLDQISEISLSSGKETAIEKTLAKIENFWTEKEFILKRTKGIVPFEVECEWDLQDCLIDDIVSFSAMKGSIYIHPFRDKIQFWLDTLQKTNTVLDQLLETQKEWLFMEQIFSKEEIGKEIPCEKKRFKIVCSLWASIVLVVTEWKKVIETVIKTEELPEMLENLKEEMKELREGLGTLLSGKRQDFPRFYFISDQDLLELMVHSKNPRGLNHLLNKMFKGVYDLVVNEDGSVFSVISKEAEELQLIEQVNTGQLLEFWMNDFDKSLKITVKSSLENASESLSEFKKEEEWLLRSGFPGHSCLTALRIQWTLDSMKAIYESGSGKSGILKKISKRLKKRVGEYSDILRGKSNKDNRDFLKLETSLERLKVTNVLITLMYLRDVTERLHSRNCTDLESFEWLQYMRFYWEAGECRVKQAYANLQFGCEYLGNLEEIFITPLTERCFMALTTAVSFHFGAYLHGSINVGKKKTINGLGSMLGRHVLNLSVSGKTEQDSLSASITGIVQTGSWLVLHGIDKLPPSLITLVSNKLDLISYVKREKLQRVMLDGTEVTMDGNCGVFGILGEVQCQTGNWCSLRGVMRPVAMIQPDAIHIVQMKFFLSGFENSASLAKKIEAIFSTVRDILCGQNRCQFSLDAMLSVTSQAVEFKRIFGQRLNEAEATIKALQNIISSTLTPHENLVFNSIIKDNFPDETPLKAEDAVIEEAIRNSFAALKYQVSETMVKLCLRLNEIMQVYKSVIITGNTGSGKSVIRSVLRHALTSLSSEKEIKEFVINPIVVDESEFSGSSNISSEGGNMQVVVRNLLRYDRHPKTDSMIVGTTEDEVREVKWIVFDGPMDEHGSTELEFEVANNPFECRASIFVETDDVSHFSPRFIAKAGVLFVNDHSSQWKLSLKAWLNGLHGSATKNELSNYATKLIEKCFHLRAEFCERNVVQNKQATITSFMRIMDSFILSQNLEKIAGENMGKFCMLLKQIFSFCIVWSLFGTLVGEDQLKVSAFIKDLDGSVFPPKGTVFDYYIDQESQRWIKWEDLAKNYNITNLSSTVGIPLMHTTETARCNYFLLKLRGYSAVLLTGLADAGKTSVVKHSQQVLSSSSNIFLQTKMTPLMKARSIQALIESRLQPVSSMVLSPSRGKSLTVFIDDLNALSLTNKMETKPTAHFEFIRHLIEYRMWYDQENGNCLAVSNTAIIAAATLKGHIMESGIPPRLQSKFFPVFLPKPDDFKLRKIFMALLTRKLTDFPCTVKSLADGITVATLELHRVITSNIPHSPFKPLHAFDIHDISKVYSGLMRANKGAQDTKLCFLKLWFHECERVYKDRLMDACSRQKCKELLTGQLLKHFELQVRNLFPPGGFSIFGNFMSRDKLYEEIKNEVSVRKLLENVSDAERGRKVVVFLEAIKEIAKIARAISSNEGHLINCGTDGQGRETLTKLVAKMLNYKVFVLDELPFTPSSSLKGDCRLSLLQNLREIYHCCGVDKDGCCLIIKDGHITDETLELISVCTSTVEIPELYSKIEFDEIKQKFLKRASLTVPGRKEKVLVLDDCNASILEYFREEVRRNLHVVLCLNPLKKSFRTTILKNTSLLKQMNINWFNIWSETSYREVTEKLLPDNPKIQNRQFTPSCCSTIHNIAAELGKSEESGCDKIMPTHLMDFLELIKSLQETCGKTIRDRMKTLKNAMENISQVQAKIGRLTDEALKAENTAQISRKACDDLNATIGSQAKDTNSQERLVDGQSGELDVEEKEFGELAESIKLEWAGALRDFEESAELLEDLSVEDLTHIRSYYSPPPMVSRVLDAVMIMLDREQNWPEAKVQLSNPDFIRNIVEFDKTRVTMEKLQSLRKYVQNKDFTPEAVAKYSNGARVLCAWIHAIEKYGRIYLTRIIPKREKLEESQGSIEEKRNSLDLNQQKLQLLQENLKELKGIYEVKFQLRQVHEEESQKCTEILERAKSVLELMKDDLHNWKEELGQLETSLENLTGDSLLAAAYLTYLGPFNSIQRKRIKYEWMKRVNESGLKFSSDWNLKKFLGRPLIGLEVLMGGFDINDEYFVENKLIFDQGCRLALLIDPHDLAVKVVRHVNKKNGPPENDNVTMILLPESNMSGTIANHVKNWENVVDTKIKIQANDQTFYEPMSRRLVFKSKEMGLKIDSTVSSKYGVINFSYDEAGLVHHIAGSIARNIDFAGFEKRNSLLQRAITEEIRISELRDRIPSLIISCGDSILENSEFPETLSNWKKECKEAEENAKEIYVEINETEIKKFYDIAERFADVFTVICNLCHSQYHQEISLDHFLTLIEKSIKDYYQISMSESPTSSPRKDTTDAVKFLGGPGFVNVIRYLQRSMFHQEKYEFALLLCAKALLRSQHSQDLLELVDLLTETKPNGIFECGNGEWKLSENHLTMLNRLIRLEKFANLVESIKVTEKEAWEVWIRYSEPENKFPDPWSNKLGNFDKVTLLSILRPDRVFSQIKSLTVETFGEECADALFSSHILDLKEVYEDVSFISSTRKVTPVLFLMDGSSSCSNPKNSVVALSKSLKQSQKLFTLQVSNKNRKLARKLIEEGTEKGAWVYFVNCHLCLEWMWELQHILEENDKVHPGFCLWMCSYLTPSFPREILRNSVKVVVESPQRIGVSITRLFRKMEWLNKEPFGSQPKFKRLLFGLAYFHCSLLGRYKFQQWSSLLAALNSVGNWDPFCDADFEIATAILKIFALSRERVEWWALKEMLELQYSNHFSSGWTQQRLIRTMVQRIFRDEAITEPEFSLSFIGPAITMPPFEVDDQNRKVSRNSLGDLTPLHQYIPSIDFCSVDSNENPEVYGLSKNIGFHKNMHQAKEMLQALNFALRQILKLVQQNKQPYFVDDGEYELNLNCENENKIQKQSQSIAQGHQEEQSIFDKTKSLVRDLLDKLPNHLDESELTKLVEPDESEEGRELLSFKLPQYFVLLMEVKQFNAELRKTKNSLQYAYDAIIGETNFDAGIQEMLYGKGIPNPENEDHQKYIVLWIDNICQRREMLQMLMNETGYQKKVCIKSLLYPKALFTTELLLASRKYNLPFTSLIWKLQQTEDELTPAYLENNESVAHTFQVDDSFIIGATWDKGKLCLQEPNSIENFMELKSVQIIPAKRNGLVSGFYLSPLYRFSCKGGLEADEILKLEIDFGDRENMERWNFHNLCFVTLNSSIEQSLKGLNVKLDLKI